MIEKVGAVRNPLTIIAIFAGLAEVGGTIVLPTLQYEIQKVYVWFLILFPMMLVGTFFFVLYHKHEVLYAPSDFHNEESFMKLFERQTPAQRVAQLQQETSPIVDPEVADPTATVQLPAKLALSSAWPLAADLVINELTSIHGWLKVERDVRAKGDNKMTFDAVCSTNAHDIVIEVLTSRNPRVDMQRINSLLERIDNFYNALDSASRDRFQLMIAIIYRNQLAEASSSFHLDSTTTRPYAVELRTYTLDHLIAKAKLNVELVD